MKHLLIILLMLASFQVMGQRMNEYTASNGITYKPGDTIELNQGSGANGDFVYLTIGTGCRPEENTYSKIKGC